METSSSPARSKHQFSSVMIRRWHSLFSPLLSPFLVNFTLPRVSSMTPFNQLFSIINHYPEPPLTTAVSVKIIIIVIIISIILSLLLLLLRPFVESGRIHCSNNISSNFLKHTLTFFNVVKYRISRTT